MSTDVTFHSVAKVEAESCAASFGKTQWTVLTVFDAAGLVVGEVTFFSSGAFPVVGPWSNDR